MSIYEELESEVRSYSRNFPTVFAKAKNAKMYDEQGREFIDFFAGSGALNYGHNNDFIKARLIKYLENDCIIHSLDMFTSAKTEFLEVFKAKILNPRNLDYKVMFCGPTGTNAVEAALKICRKVTGRENIIAFMGAFHGMTLGSLALTSNRDSRLGAGTTLPNVTFVPYPGMIKGLDTIAYIDNLMTDDHSGVAKPAAIFVECVQADGGINVADDKWLRALRELCNRHEILLVCDDIQVGCGRTGPFFSFERAGIVPDAVTLSKSISGYGLPMALLLFKPEMDVWKPGEHTGTFRGNQLAFVGATAALEYREQVDLQGQTERKAAIMSRFIEERILPLHPAIMHRGVGLVHGIDFSGVGIDNMSKRVQHECFENGLIIERVGRGDCTLKLMPPLVIEGSEMLHGMEIIEKAIKRVLKEDL